jgi:competence protein ComEC
LLVSEYPYSERWLMVLVGLVIVAGARVASPAQGFVIALVVVVGVDPVAFLSAGFWLSFLAVAALLTAFAGRVGGGTGWRTYILVAVRAQLAIAPVLTPCLVLMKSEASLVAWLVNLLAIPWVSFTVIAPLLAGTLLLPLSETVASWPLAVAEFSLGVLWHALLRASAYAPTLRLATSPLFVPRRCWPRCCCCRRIESGCGSRRLSVGLRLRPVSCRSVRRRAGL